MARIGIYSGTFNPVHTGHVAFALQALVAAQLDEVYFLPERRPRGKQSVEHFAHRVAMLKKASKPHSQFKVLEFVDVSFTVERTLPTLQQLFEGDTLVFLLGSDVVPNVASWPHADTLLANAEIIIGLRSGDKREAVHAVVESWTTQPQAVTVLESFAPDVSSAKIREAMRNRQTAEGLLKSVERYSDHNWLYVSLSGNNTTTDGSRQ